MKFLFSFCLVMIACFFYSCNSNDKVERIDHIILAINNLENGIRQFENLTGIKPVYGGVHPNSFTQNAIVALNSDSYIEILAPRPDADSIPDWINKLDSLTPFGWAVNTSNINTTRSKISFIGLEISNLLNGSRKTANGDTLKWETFNIQTNSATPYPFFINWDSRSTHPSKNAPKGCKLVSLKIASKDNSLLMLSKTLNIHFDLINDDTNKISFEIESPKGKVIFK